MLNRETIKYQVSIKGTVKYKLKPLPTLEISEVHVSKKNENSILNKVFLILFYDAFLSPAI